VTPRARRTPSPSPSPTPTPSPAVPAEAVPPVTGTPTPTPTPTLSRDEDRTGLLVAGAVVGAPLALAGLVGLALFLLARLGWAEEPRARLAHAWREAGYRAGGAWADFSDWVRLGR
jgi:hypothetical protein